jgi:hypothetical protein
MFHVSRVIITWLVTYDNAWLRHGIVCLMSSLFLSCVFYWLSLPHLDCHVNHDWLHIERFHGAVPGIWADRIWDGLVPSIYIGDILYMEANSWFIRLSENWLTFCTVVSPPCRPFVRNAADRGRAVSPNRCWWYETCTGAGESGFWEVRSHDRSRSSFACSSSTVSSSIRAWDPL